MVLVRILPRVKHTHIQIIIMHRHTRKSVDVSSCFALYTVRVYVCVPSVNIVQRIFCLTEHNTSKAKARPTYQHTHTRTHAHSEILCSIHYACLYSIRMYHQRAHIYLSHSSTWFRSICFAFLLFFVFNFIQRYFFSADLLILETITKFYTFTAERCLASTFLSQTSLSCASIGRIQKKNI